MVHINVTTLVHINAIRTATCLYEVIGKKSRISWEARPAGTQVDINTGTVGKARDYILIDFYICITILKLKTAVGGAGHSIISEQR